MTPFSSVLSATIQNYLTLKRALGRQYSNEEHALAHLDRFLAAPRVDLVAETFAAWCLTLQHLASVTRRGRMRVVRNLCLYRRRGEPGCFVPMPPARSSTVNALLRWYRRRTRRAGEAALPGRLHGARLDRLDRLLPPVRRSEGPIPTPSGAIGTASCSCCASSQPRRNGPSSSWTWTTSAPSRSSRFSTTWSSTGATECHPQCAPRRGPRVLPVLRPGVPRTTRTLSTRPRRPVQANRQPPRGVPRARGDRGHPRRRPSRHRRRPPRLRAPRHHVQHRRAGPGNRRPVRGRPALGHARAGPSARQGAKGTSLPVVAPDRRPAACPACRTRPRAAIRRDSLP